jgi:hypothetical protein
LFSLTSIIAGQIEVGVVQLTEIYNLTLGAITTGDPVVSPSISVIKVYLPDDFNRERIGYISQESFRVVSVDTGEKRVRHIHPDVLRSADVSAPVSRVATVASEISRIARVS